MEYAEAVKKIQTNKTKDNFMVISVSYNSKLILPYKDGLSFMAALSNAEQLHDPYNENHRINPLEQDAITTRIMSGTDYDRYKIAALLNVSIDDVKKYEQPAT